MRRNRHRTRAKCSSGASGSALFVGPLDGLAKAPFAAYSLRRLLSAYDGPLVRLRRASDDAESDFGYDADGWLDVAGITSWLADSIALITTTYDQVGSIDLTQGNAANQPTLILSTPIFGNRPAFNFDSTNDQLVYDAGTQIFSSVAAAAYVGVAPNEANIWWDGCPLSIKSPFGQEGQVGGAGLHLSRVGLAGAGNEAQASKSGLTPANSPTYIPVNTAKIFSGRATASNLYCGIDGSEGSPVDTTATVAPHVFSLGSRIGSGSGAGWFGGKISECLIFSSDIALQNGNTITALRGYWI